MQVFVGLEVSRDSFSRDLVVRAHPETAKCGIRLCGTRPGRCVGCGCTHGRLQDLQPSLEKKKKKENLKGFICVGVWDGRPELSCSQLPAHVSQKEDVDQGREALQRRKMV